MTLQYINYSQGDTESSKCKRHGEIQITEPREDYALEVNDFMCVTKRQFTCPTHIEAKQH